MKMSMVRVELFNRLINSKLLLILVRDHSSITSAKRWVGRVAKWLMFADKVGWVGQMT